LRTITLVVRVPATESRSYIAKVRQVTNSLEELDFRVHLLVEGGRNPELIVQGEVIDLRKTGVRDIVRRILSYASAEVSDPDMLEKLGGAGLNESGELIDSDTL